MSALSDYPGLVRILAVEDDDRVARGLVRALLRAGHRVVRAADVAEAYEAIAEQVPDLALVDMGLPDGHGSAVVRRLRAHPATGVLIVTAHDGPVERGVILDRVWSAPSEAHSRTLDTHMATLRGKVEGRLRIRTLRGVGYQAGP